MNYAALLTAISDAHQQAQAGAAGAVNRHLILRNWLIGAYLVEFEQNGEDRAKYRAGLLKRVSADLRRQDIPGTSTQMLERMRLFYNRYPQLRSAIPSSVMRNSSIHLSASALAISSSPPMESPAAGTLEIRQPLVGESSMLEKASPPVSKSPTEPRPLIPAMLLRFSWTHLLELIRLDDPWKLDHLQTFLLELGTGFCFEARQKRITVGNEHDYIDLVFYHRLLRCHLLIDLKIRAFQHGDAGQMNFYVNYWKENVMAQGDQPPVGLLLCTDKDQTKVEYATGGLDHQLFVSRYLVALPKSEQLQQLIETDRAVWEQHHPEAQPEE